MVRLNGARPSFATTTLWGLLATTIASVHALTLEPRNDKNDTLPAAISITPFQGWDGIDGQWNTFVMRVGEPEQFVRGFVSTASQQTWVVVPDACQQNQTDSSSNTTALVINKDCSENRGWLYNSTKSSTYKDQGFYMLWTELSMGLDGNGKFGFDTVGLGLKGEEGPTLKDVVVGGFISANFWLGHFGVNPKGTNFSTFGESSPSFMTMLFQQKKIPSVSFGYTAGAKYRNLGVLGSLTLGGHDASRYIPNDLTFGFAPDNERDIVVPVVSIKSSSATRSNVDLLGKNPITMYIDSTLSEIWLPESVCKTFESTFGLKYDNATGLYLVDSMLHSQLQAENPSVTFTLGQKFSVNATVDITLPYNAFDLLAKPPYRGLQNQTNYFPIRRAVNETQFVLGRTFLQEAYLLVDWERQNFSVYQNKWDIQPEKQIVSIISPNYTGERKSKHHLSRPAVIGISIACAFVGAMICFGILWFFWRKRHIAKIKAKYEAKAAAAKENGTEKKSGENDRMSSKADPEELTNVIPKAELHADSSSRLGILPDVKNGDVGIPSPLSEVANNERQVFEMPGDVPARLEAGGRQLSEKESMVVRERIYNGVDPQGLPSVSPTTEETPRRAAPVSPSEVAIVNRRGQANVSPATPRNPRDGALLESSDTFFNFGPPRSGRHLEAEDTILSPISPLEGSEDAARRRFSYE